MIISSYLIFSSFLLLAFYFHLIPSLISGLLVYLIVNKLYEYFNKKGIHSDLSKKLSLFFISGFTVLFLSLIVYFIYKVSQFGNDSFMALGSDIIKILDDLKKYLPESVINYIPNDFMHLKESLSHFMKSHVVQMLSITGSSTKTFFHIIIGAFIGSCFAFSMLSKDKNENITPFLNQLKERVNLFNSIFGKVLFAQIKISAINTVLTGIYLLGILPILGFKIPYATTLVLCTFLFGLLPVIGNLITNVLIVLLSLLVSFEVAVSSLLFLVIIHKLEYYINAKIVGQEIKTSIGELLVAMIIMETIFGIPGIILAPILYGYIKEELKLNKLI